MNEWHIKIPLKDHHALKWKSSPISAAVMDKTMRECDPHR